MVQEFDLGREGLLRNSSVEIDGHKENTLDVIKMRHAHAERPRQVRIEAHDVNIGQHLEGEAEGYSEESFHCRTMQEDLMGEASFDQYQGVDQTLLMLLRKHVLKK